MVLLSERFYLFLLRFFGLEVFYLWCIVFSIVVVGNISELFSLLSPFSLLSAKDFKTFVLNFPSKKQVNSKPPITILLSALSISENSPWRSLLVCRDYSLGSDLFQSRLVAFGVILFVSGLLGMNQGTRDYSCKRDRDIQVWDNKLSDNQSKFIDHQVRTTYTSDSSSSIPDRWALIDFEDESWCV